MLVLGDMHIPHRAAEIPAQLKKMLVSNKLYGQVKVQGTDFLNNVTLWLCYGQDTSKRVLPLRAGARQDAIRSMYRKHVCEGTRSSQFRHVACDLADFNVHFQINT